MAGQNTDGLLPYVYHPLPSPSHIRLLRRRGQTADGTLVFALTTRDINDAAGPQYHCMSYTWGNPFAHGNHFDAHFDAVGAQYDAAHTVPVVLDEGGGKRVLRIQRNLRDALRTVPRSAYVDYMDRPLAGEKGRTYLHVVAGEGKADVVDAWLWNGADADRLDDGGRTALHYAAEGGHAPCVDILCRAGSLRSRRDNEGSSPMDLAKAGGHGDVVTLLESLASQPDPVAETSARNPEGADWLVWADAICINQADVDEKSAQVNMMDRIYINASYVIAWLGPPDQHSELGIATLRVLKAHLRQFQGSQIEPFGGTDRDMYEAAGVPFISRPGWIALASIYRRQWFRRAWIVQEAILPRNILMYIGGTCVSWYDLGEVATALRHSEAKLGKSGSTAFVPATDAAVPVEWNMAEVHKYRTNRNMAVREDIDNAHEYKALFALKDLVFNFWTFMASDPRDKVFALYGMFNAFASDRLTTNYRLSLSSVYTATARQIILASGGLEVLSACVYQAQRRDGLPSWVPDFSLPGINAVPEIFSADEGLEYQPPQNDTADSPVLRLGGLKIGTISRAGGRPNTGPSGKLQFDPSWLRMVLSLRGQGGYGEQPVLSEILWRTLCMDMSPGSLFDAKKYGSRAPDEFGTQFRMFMLLMILAGADRMVLEKAGAEPNPNETFTISRLSYNPMDADMESTLADLDTLAAHDGELHYAPLRQEVLYCWDKLECTLVRNTRIDADGGPNDFYVSQEVREGKERIVGNGFVVAGSRMFQRCHAFASTYVQVYGGRQLVTVDDTYLGMAALSAEAGDEIWILPGLRAPAVMRPAATQGAVPRYRFVGSCYVHGLMHGEVGASGSAVLGEVELV